MYYKLLTFKPLPFSPRHICLVRSSAHTAVISPSTELFLIKFRLDRQIVQTEEREDIERRENESLFCCCQVLVYCLSLPTTSKVMAAPRGTKEYYFFFFFSNRHNASLIKFQNLRRDSLQ